MLDLKSKAVTRLVDRASVRWYEFSPDNTKVAYTALKGWEANSQQPNFDVVVVDLPSGKPSRTLALNARFGYGFEFMWTPDSREIAYISSGQVTKGPIIVLPVDGSASRTLKAEGVPSFDPGEGEQAPVSGAKGDSFLRRRRRAVAGRCQDRGGQGGREDPGVEDPRGHPAYGRPTLLSAPDGKTVYVVAREAPKEAGASGPTAYWNDSGRGGIFALDITTGDAKLIFADNRSIRTVFNLDADAKAGIIVFSSTDQQHCTTCGSSTRRPARSARSRT